jgi:4-diphosphocytidyl-2-C-methyl-D-erythritol kinase
MLTVLAPAKINLTLEALAKCPDGFHEIRSVIQTISLSDSLNFQLGRNIEFNCDNPEWLPEKSLASKAASLLQEVTGCHRGATIEINNRIPLVSGLGGDSSDAAAVLRGLNALWDLGLSTEELVKLASQLGSDVAFFFHGGTALVGGRGEIVTPLPPFPHMWVVLMVPPVPRLLGKTGQLYASLKTNHYTDGQITEKLVEILRGGREFMPSLLFNTFENVAFTHQSKINVYRSHAIKVGAPNVHLAGSGPTLYTLLEDKAQAEELYIRLQHQKMQPYLAETLASIEQIE